MQSQWCEGQHKGKAMKAITIREIPEGYALDPAEGTTWNVGHVFRWSEVYDCYLEHGIITVRPNDSLAESFERVYDTPMWPEYEIFFLEETV